MSPMWQTTDGRKCEDRARIRRIRNETKLMCYNEVINSPPMSKGKPLACLVVYAQIKVIHTSSQICVYTMSIEQWASCLQEEYIMWLLPPASQFSFSIVKLPSESAKFIVTKTLWQGRMWDYYKSFSDKKYIFGSKKILFNSYSGTESTNIFLLYFHKTTS